MAPRARLSKFADAIAQRLSRVTSGEHLIPEVDGLRFGALLLVVLHHVAASYLTTQQPYGPINLPMEWLKAGDRSWFFYAVSHVGFAIPMFFVLSGFILSLPFLRAAVEGKPHPGFKRFFLRRLTRMEPPYAAALLLHFALQIALGKSAGELAPHLAASAAYLHAAIYGGSSWILNVAWTLEIDAQFYLALPLLQWLLFRKNPAVRRALIGSLILAGGLASQLYFDRLIAPRVLNLGLANWIQFFAAGFLLADVYLDCWRNRPARRPLLWDAAGIIFFALILADVLQRPHARIPWWVQSSWNGGLGAFLLPWLIIGAFAGVFRGAALKWLFTRRWVAIGGGMSYTIYLYHFATIDLFIRPVCGMIGHALNPEAASLLAFFFLLIPIFAISTVLFLLIEKPCMRWRPNIGFPALPALTRRQALLYAAAFVAVIKAIQYSIDSQAVFYFDSPAFLFNALGAFIPQRSYFYGGLIRVFAAPFHSYAAIVVMQIAISALTAWLLAFALLQFFRVRPWIAILAALAFAIDPVQVLYERLVMTENVALFVIALYLLASLAYLRSRSLLWLAAIALLGACLVGMRIAYLPCVLAFALLLPAGAWLRSSGRRGRALAMALAVSCGATFFFQSGYRHLTGLLAHREPAYQYATGFFMLAGVSSLVQPRDAQDLRIAQGPRIAESIEAQNRSRIPLLPRFREDQLWQPDGLVARINAIFPGDARSADEAARSLAFAAIERNPAGYLWLGVRTYSGYWSNLPRIDSVMNWEDGLNAAPWPPEYQARLLPYFGAKPPPANTPARKYHKRADLWYLFLLAAPFLAGGALWLNPKPSQPMALLFVWNLLVLAAVCFGSVTPAYRFLHPFSFTGLATAAVLGETLAARRAKPANAGLMHRNRVASAGT